MTGTIFGTRIIAAPMAGGTSTPRFVQAAHQAGGLGFLAAGYKTVAAMQSDIREVRSAGARFGMNLFVPDRTQLNPPPAVREQLENYRRNLEPDAGRYGVALPGLRLDDDDEWQGKIDALLADPVEFVSFTFGLPEQAEVRALKRAGSTIIATVTSPAEASLAVERGADILVIQHGSAGGHSAAFLARESTTDSPAPRRRRSCSPRCAPPSAFPSSRPAESWIPRTSTRCSPPAQRQPSWVPRFCAATKAAPASSTRTPSPAKALPRLG